MFFSDSFKEMTHENNRRIKEIGYKYIKQQSSQQARYSRKVF